MAGNAGYVWWWQALQGTYDGGGGSGDGVGVQSYSLCPMTIAYIEIALCCITLNSNNSY